MRSLARTTFRATSGNYMTLQQLVQVLPQDYLLHIYIGDREVWTGISWVFLYDSCFARFSSYSVWKFEMDYNNTEATINMLIVR